MPVVHVIDVDSGNLQSLQNALEYLNYEVVYIKNGLDTKLFEEAQLLILPGVGNYGHFTSQLVDRNLFAPIKKYIAQGKPLMGICVGLQALCEGSEEDKLQSKGINEFEGIQLKRFNSKEKSVPQIGWNTSEGDIFGIGAGRYYFVHSYAAIVSDEEIAKLKAENYKLSICKYGSEKFIAAISKNNVFATQFHPEKSGALGIELIGNFLRQSPGVSSGTKSTGKTINNLSYRIIACLDVRNNDQGDLVVTKGDQYDVREKLDSTVRNLGKPVELAEKYYRDGADEITFLNITSFQNCPLQDLPMLEVLRQASKTIFVPLTVGGGIKNFTNPDGTVVSSLTVAETYFKSGADKVSIGSDAVYTAEKFLDHGATGDSPIELISKNYGNQAVVVSVDPKRVYVDHEVPFKCFTTKYPGPNGETSVYYAVSVKGGREFSSRLGVYELVTICEKLGAGEILLNCIDKDGSNSGFDLELIQFVKDSVSIPVIASSGAGSPEHFYEVFSETSVDAALGAGIFHRNEYTVAQVKQCLREKSLQVR